MKKETDSSSDAVSIIAGPCSIDENNAHELFEIADIEVKTSDGKPQKAIAGVRVVGLKSRTALKDEKESMGIDYDFFKQNFDLLMQSKKSKFKCPPSVEIASDISKKTGMIVASEIMSPLVQLPLYEKRIKDGKLIIWNPSVNQLGWQAFEMGQYAQKNKWKIALKNGKWLDCKLSEADDAARKDRTDIEKAWEGLAKYTRLKSEDIIYIHRGFDIESKGSYRNLPLHNLARRVKQNNPGAKMYFDPSHSFGPKMRDKILEGTVDAMKLTTENGGYIYDGILIEVGHSQTDTNQHITIEELKKLAQKLADFRSLIGHQ
ncbi:hypothetical protein Dip510_000929 [Elusimicrobium posterum]|uniref:hypothetical protein n=1 Tax=Elusimicrobium posterum TaxID=3116653 RepID=UPI003C70E7BA